MTQDEALDILKTGANVFLTGEPGSGKTHTVNRYVSYLRDSGIEPSITASTGIAATHIGGQTLHSWSGIGVRQSLDAYDLDAISSNRRVYTRIAAARVLIIDEVSMLSAATLGMAEAVCREVRKGQQRAEQAFGGLQVILVGDFFQLPPVSARETKSESGQAELAPSERSDSTGFAFAAPMWEKASPLVCYLSEQHRQEDAAFLDFLSAVRKGKVEERHKVLLRKRYAKAPPMSTTTQLYSHNADVDHINTAELSKLPGKPNVFVMESSGPDPLVAMLKKGCLSPETLSLKLGARVMFTKNDIERRFVNGTIGTISGFDKTSGLPVITTTSGREILAEPQSWVMQDGPKILAQITQVPLRLAWAITVHKSQGMSLDSAHMNLADAFEYGQGYVALSRVRTLAGLSLAGLNARALEVHPKIKEKDAQFRAASDAVRTKFRSLPNSELLSLHGNFLRAIGGKPGTGKQKSAAQGERKEPKEKRWEDTAALIYAGKTIVEAAALRGRTTGTIFEHLEKLAALDKLSLEKLAHLKPTRLTNIEKAFIKVKAQTGESKLTPVRELLGDSYSYDELRLARLFLRL